MIIPPHKEIRVHDIVQRPVLISRECARTLQAPLSESVVRVHGTGESSLVVVVDFVGISGVAPSFVDELIRMFEELLADHGDAKALRMTIKNVPMRLSATFSSIARGHCLSIEEFPDGSWELRSSAA